MGILPRVFWKCPSKEESTKNDYKHSETRIWHRLNPKEGEGEPGEETKESEGDMAGERQRKVETTVAGGQDELFLGPVTKESVLACKPRRPAPSH